VKLTVSGITLADPLELLLAGSMLVDAERDEVLDEFITLKRDGLRAHARGRGLEVHEQFWCGINLKGITPVALDSHGQCCCQIVAKFATESPTRLAVGGLLERTEACRPSPK
jgi:hypothetical protein